MYTQIYSNMFITSYCSSFYLWWKESLLKHKKKSQNIMTMIAYKILFCFLSIALRFAYGERKVCWNIKSLKILWPWLFAKYYFAFYHFIAAEIVQNSHILAGIYFSFLKILLDRAWKSFNVKFTHQWKHGKESYLVRPVLTIFCDLVRP